MWNKEKAPTKIGFRTMAKAKALGLVITDPNQFELAAQTKVILFNKTGIFTDPILKVVEFRLAHNSPKTHQNELLALAAALEAGINHPIATSIVKKSKRHRLPLPQVADIQFFPGQGVTGILDGQEVFAGGPSLLLAKNISIHLNDLAWSDEVNQTGNTVVYLAQNFQLIGMIQLSDSILPEAAALVNKFHAQKIRVAMVTGGATSVAEYLAKQLKIATVFAEIPATQRADVVRKLKSDGSKVALVGHLDTDAEALSEAQIGIAINSDGTTDSIAAGLHLRSGGMAEVLQVILLAKGFKAARMRKWIAVFTSVLVVIGFLTILISSK